MWSLCEILESSTEVTNASLAQFSPGPGPGLVGISGIMFLFLMLSVSEETAKTVCRMSMLSQNVSIQKKKAHTKNKKEVTRVLIL